MFWICVKTILRKIRSLQLKKLLELHCDIKKCVVQLYLNSRIVREKSLFAWRPQADNKCLSKKILWSAKIKLNYLGKTPKTMCSKQQALVITWKHGGGCILLWGAAQWQGQDRNWLELREGRMQPNTVQQGLCRKPAASTPETWTTVTLSAWQSSKTCSQGNTGLALEQVSWVAQSKPWPKHHRTSVDGLIVHRSFQQIWQTLRGPAKENDQIQVCIETYPRSCKRDF